MWVWEKVRECAGRPQRCGIMGRFGRRSVRVVKGREAAIFVGGDVEIVEDAVDASAKLYRRR